MTTAPDEPKPALLEMMTDLMIRIAPHIEHIKFLRGHAKHKGWGLKEDPVLGEARYHCGCGDWLDDYKEAEDDDGDGEG